MNRPSAPSYTSLVFWLLVLVLVLFSIGLARGADCGHRCGTYRWAVKTASDGAQLSPRPRDMTIAQLAALGRPAGPLTTRRPGTEQLQFRVTGQLKGVRLEPDGDYHILLASGQQVLVCEIPDPDCSGACSSPFRENYASARKAIDRLLGHPPRRGWSIPHSPTPIRLRGFGFFDKPHGVRGAAPNGIELHPVIAVETPIAPDIN